MKGFFFFTLFLSVVLFSGYGQESQHPRIYISDSKKTAFEQKLETSEWAKQSFDSLKARVEPYVNRHQTDPDWIVSRLQMYWDTHYERVYVNGGFFSHGTGKAPVPTVKFMGARDWETDYAMPSIEETQPYMDSKGMYLQNMKKEGHPWEWVHPSKTGRIIGPMNDRIMELASNAAFLYWFTGEKKYAVFARDIFMTYIKGMYYRREPFTLEDHANGQLMGLATFEVILDHIIVDLSLCYDFLYDYLKTQKEDKAMIETVLKRFADQQIMYGVPDNNWNIFQARHIAYLALALDNDSQYEDKKGKQYYLNEIFNHTTIRQVALKEAMDLFDKETATWLESATYSMSVCNDMMDIISLIDNAENNHLLDTFPIMKRAVPATVQYLFPNGRVTAFGDAKYVPLRTGPFEMLIALYRKYGDKENEKKLTQILQRMINDGDYNRGDNKNIFSLFFYVDQLGKVNDQEATYNHFLTNSFFIPGVSWFIQRNGFDKENGLAVSQTGAFGNHAHANGISVEMYGKGLMFAPESSYGVSYSSKDNQEYYARFPAHNTVVVDGKSDYGMMRSYYPFRLMSYYPATGDTSRLFGDITFSRVELTEPKTNAEQERLTGTIRTGEKTGYIVDIFRSKRKDGKDLKHEYIFHGIGQSLDVMNTGGQPLALQPVGELSSDKGDLSGYNYFDKKQGVAYDNDFTARFNIDTGGQESIKTGVWMQGYPERTVFSVMSPSSHAFVKGSVPDELLDAPLPTLIVRQSGEAWTRPFVAVYEPYTVSEKSSIQSVDYFGKSPGFNGIAVSSKSGRNDYIFNCTEESALQSVRDMQFHGIYGIISEMNGNPVMLFLGEGIKISKGKWEITTTDSKTQACLIFSTPVFGELKTTGNILLTVPFTSGQTVFVTDANGKIINGKVRTGDKTAEIELQKGIYQLKIKK